jgi:hypothetical protein
LPKTADYFVDNLPSLKANKIPRKDNLELGSLHLDHFNKKRMKLIEKLIDGRLQMLNNSLEEQDIKPDLSKKYSISPTNRSKFFNTLEDGFTKREMS